MAEEKKDTKNTQENTNINTESDSSTIDFSKFSIGPETPLENNNNPFGQNTETKIENTETTNNEIKQTTQDQQQTETQEVKQEIKQDGAQIPQQGETQNLIAQLNEMKEDTAPDIEVNSLNIKEGKEEDNKTPVLGTSGIEEIKTQKTNKKIETIMFSYIVIAISIIAIIIIGLYSKYVGLTSGKIETTQESFVQKVKTITKTISEYTKINEYALRADKTDVLTNDNAKKLTKQVIENKKLNYIHKKDILEKNVQILVQQTIGNANTLDNKKKEIIKYGFIPEQLFNIISEHQGISGIQKRIALMENIKLITAAKAFSYMESFVKGLANSLGESELLIESKLQNIIINAEKDIINYTNTCFLNPYEITINCDTINDFDNYYKLIEPERSIDTKFITQLANYIENKLQETDIPSFNIRFLKFNPKEDSVNFVIDLNTNTQDEIALNKQGILNPHVFIVTNIINLLKQSLLVIGENIKADQIKTSPKTIKLGSTVFTVNNSSIELNLPIQKSSQREISDFFSNK